MTRFYAGIGSRKTPQPILSLMTTFAVGLRLVGFTLRSGGARGADQAFELGAGAEKQIFYAGDVDQEALVLAEKFHPAWGRCSDYAKLLHARNGYQVLGRNLKSQSSFVVCWTADGKATGGTGQAIRIAEGHGIPVFNMYRSTAQQEISDWLRANPA